MVAGLAAQESAAERGSGRYSMVHVVLIHVLGLRVGVWDSRSRINKGQGFRV